MGLDRSQNLVRTSPHDPNRSQNMVRTSPRVLISSGGPDKPRSSEHLERKASAFFATFILSKNSKSNTNMICASPEKQQIS